MRLGGLVVAVLVLAGVGIGIGLSVSSTATHNVQSSSANEAALIASCNADAKSVETAAAAAYQSQIGTLPSDVGALTATTVVNGSPFGPWLRALPNSPDYSLSVAPSGDVIVHSKTGRGGGDYEATNYAACDL